MSKLNYWKTACVLCALCAAAVIASPAQTFTRLLSFNGLDGIGPHSTLVQGTDGNLYGSAQAGGNTNFECMSDSCGTLFKITPKGVLKRLYFFCSYSGCDDGSEPDAAPVQAYDGNFYGTTYSGGYNAYAGSVYKITPSGKLTTLYSFCKETGCTAGYNPYAGLVQGTEGNFYGTTTSGGTYCCGTIFKITPSGTLTVLHSFPSDDIDGAYPYAALIQGTDGNFYGTTYGGGVNGAGTVFKITPSGTLTTLYSFCLEDFCRDGYNPYAGLVQGTDGSFYGTTYYGGVNNGGTVFEITPSGALKTLYSFCSQSGCADGEYVLAGLIQATDGNFYGTTYDGGANDPPNGGGTVFKITPSGTLTTLHSFCAQSNCTDGANPEAALVQDTNGTIYGTTALGGTFDAGTEFSESVGLGAFVETQPTSGKTGAAVKILGTNLTGTTSVMFNGTAATFTVAVSSEITTTVPTGASTGPVQVTTPSGTLTSNVPFRVLP